MSLLEGNVSVKILKDSDADSDSWSSDLNDQRENCLELFHAMPIISGTEIYPRMS